MTPSHIVESAGGGDEALGPRAIMDRTVGRRLSEVISGLLNEIRDRRVQAGRVVVASDREGQLNSSDSESFEIVHGRDGNTSLRGVSRRWPITP